MVIEEDIQPKKYCSIKGIIFYERLFAVLHPDLYVCRGDSCHLTLHG